MSEKPLISCNIYGQLGNQLFILAAAMAYSWDYDAEPVFPMLHIQKNRTSYNKDKLFFRLNAGPAPRPFLHIYRTDLEKEWCSPQRIPFAPDLIIDGYFQSWTHFHHHREKILNIFAPSESTTRYLEQKYPHLLRNSQVVGVHVRTQSKSTHEEGHHPFWGMDYYEKAISLFPSNYTFVIFSDRINWCKHHFAKLDRNFIFIEGNDGVEDLFLLASCYHQILCNSSYSWWAAYFHSPLQGKSFFPKDWRDPSLVPNPPEAYFFLPEWELLECPKKKPYPEDLFFYDALSKSVDNN